MNSKRYKGRATWRKGTFTAACYCAGEAALPVSCCQRASRPSYFLRTFQHTVFYHSSCKSSTEEVRPCVLRALALAFEYWDAGSLFSGAERMDATRRRCNMPSHSGSSGGVRFRDCRYMPMIHTELVIVNCHYYYYNRELYYQSHISIVIFIFNIPGQYT
jgi:hypothetical protein